VAKLDYFTILINNARVTELGEPTFEEASSVDTSATLRFRMILRDGSTISNFPYKTLRAGTPNTDSHVKDNVTEHLGRTAIVSTKKGERVDFYLVWARVEVNKSFFKG